MNAHIAKLALTLCSLSLLNFACSVEAQETNAEDASQSQITQTGNFVAGRTGAGRKAESIPTFDIQIENGVLSLALLGDRPEATNFFGWAPGAKSVPATMDNISRYLRSTDPHLSVVLSPGTGDVTIRNLKIRSASLPQISEAINIASGNKINGNGGRIGGRSFSSNGSQQPGDNTITFISRQSESQPVVEVFNLSGYIQTLGKVDDQAISQKLNELENHLIFPTLDSLGVIKSDVDPPQFKYHPGTKLLIVIGKPEVIDVTRKIVNALSGQEKNGRVDLLETMPSSGQN